MSNFSDSEINKLKQVISEGMQVIEETETLKGGLKDTVAAIAEELNIKPAVLNKAIRMAYKAEFSKKQEEFDDLEAILDAVGRKF